MRRLSQAISEGDGISLIAPVPDVATAQEAERQGAEGVVVERDLAGVRDATGLPILWRAQSSPAEALNGGADALLVAAKALEDDAEWLARRWAEAEDLGLECVVEVRDAEELELALERLDPEIFLLAASGGGDEGPLQHALDLLQDVPAGKLAIAELPVRGRDEVAELERAGMDAVIVPAGDVAELVGGSAPDV
jgi:indole-3-glycerol phosphate synthase